MRIGIMQPYFVPYIGYFQLIHNVDYFIFYDNVSFIKGGWVNRNRIGINGKETYLTIPCKNISSNKNINVTEIIITERERNKLLKKVEQAYVKAPYFHSFFPVYKKILQEDYGTISNLNIQFIRIICDYLQIKTKLDIASEMNIDRQNNRLQNLIKIIKSKQGKTYVNPIGGKYLYKKEEFKYYGIDLDFLECQELFYRQFDKYDFLPNLSILDVLMFNSIKETQNLLEKYEIQ